MRNLTSFGVALVASASVLAPSVLRAQGVTSASLQGTVTDASGAPVVGAEVIGTHTPSGTTYRTVTRGGGTYNLPNVRVGGPYSVSVTANGATKRVTGVYTALQQSFTVNIRLAAAGAAPAVLGQEVPVEAGGPGRVVVEASLIDEEVFSPTKQGSATNIGRDKIDSLPTISRSIQDFTRLTPQATGGSIAGGNNRFNNITIDGATINDNFGLSGSGLITDRAQPISLEVIDQIRVSISPYDVRQSNFTGGAIDAVTKSGTNTFHGSIYGYYRDADMVGKTSFAVPTLLNPTGRLSNKLTDFEEYTYGLTLGGPIIKDKLFFFFGLESKRRREPQIGSIGATNTGSGFFGTQLAIDNTNSVIATATNRYGYNPGTSGSVLDKVQDDKVFARIDWNITKDQKLTLRYNHVDANFTDGISRSNNSYTLTGIQFARPSESNSFVGQLLSTWTSAFTTEARVTYNRLRTQRQVSTAFPSVSVFVAPGSTLNFGVERSSQENALDQDIWESVFNASYFIGNHTITLGLNVDNFHYKNLFVQDAFGTYSFNSPADFAAGRPQRYRYSYLLPGGEAQADWNYYNIGLYLQDEWKVTPKLTVIAGIRADLPIFPENPRSNPQFAADFPGRDTGVLPENQWAVSPRVGFNWNVFGDLNPSAPATLSDKDGKAVSPRRSWRDEFATIVRGGVGLFNGKTPSVWISNQYSNTGLDFARIDTNSSPRTVLNPTTPPAPRVFGYGSSTFNAAVVSPANYFSANPNTQPITTPGLDTPAQTTAIALTSSDFRFPQILRGNLAVDQKLPFGLVLTVEGLASKDVEAVRYRNLNLGPRAGFAPDGRPIYSPAVNSRYTSVIEISNTSKGHSYIGTVALERPLQKDGWYFKAAYTRSNVKTAGDYGSSVALSNWQNNVISGDPNNPGVNRSLFETKDRVIGAIDYTLNVGKRWATTFGLFYEGRTGQPYTFVYSNDVNGDGVSGNDAIFVPRNPGDVTVVSGNAAYTNAQAEAALFQFIGSNKYLRENRGRVLPINGGSNPVDQSLRLPPYAGNPDAPIWFLQAEDGVLLRHPERAEPHREKLRHRQSLRRLALLERVLHERHPGQRALYLHV